MTEHLSPHFTLLECTKSQTATRHGIDNTPDFVAIQNMTTICTKILEPIRDHFNVPFSPSSMFRCRRLNAVLGGARRSQHLNGKAVDIELPGISNIELGWWIQDNLTFDRLIYEYCSPGDPEAGWIHVSYNWTDNSKKVFIYDRHPNGSSHVRATGPTNPFRQHQ